MSKDIPIIFSRPMVRALLEGRKTQTRRIVKLPTKGEYVRPDMGGWAATTVGGGNSFIVRRDGTREPARECVAIWNQTTGTCIAMNYQPGDRLWVRENWRPIHSGDPSRGAVYMADVGRDDTKWRPSIHLPRWASRLTLIVTGVQVERLQEISEADAIAEGADPIVDHGTGSAPYLHRIGFEQLWCRIHGQGAWIANPFVVAVTFRVIKANVDAPEARAA